tara:strand:- start:36 stop:659 length:624 start_codon:yes stop_codon:yes gene_type:complete
MDVWNMANNRLKNILMSCVMIFGSLSLSGCYTQLSMFYPSPEIEEEQFYSYSSAGPMKSVGMYAQDGAGQSLGMAYLTMYNRFNSMFYGSQYGSGYYNKYDYYNRYGYHAGYNGYDTYRIAGYTMYIPTTDLYAKGERKPRTFSTSRGDNSSPGTNLNTTRTRTESSTNNTNSGGYSNSSNISSTRSSSSSSTSANSSGGTRATRRN